MNDQFGSKLLQLLMAPKIGAVRNFGQIMRNSQTGAFNNPGLGGKKPKVGGGRTFTISK